MDTLLPVLSFLPTPSVGDPAGGWASRWQFRGVHGSEGRLVRCPASSLFSPSWFRIRKGRSESMLSRPPLSASLDPATAGATPASAIAKAPAPMSLLRRPLFLLILVASLGLAAASGRAAPTNDAAAFVSDLVSKAMHSLSDKALSDEQREKQFRAMLDSKFDMPRISRFVLGRYWTTASDQDKQNFQKLFEDYVVHAYAARFSQYSGEQVKVVGARPESELINVPSRARARLRRTTGPPLRSYLSKIEVAPPNPLLLPLLLCGSEPNDGAVCPRARTCRTMHRAGHRRRPPRRGVVGPSHTEGLRRKDAHGRGCE